MRLYDKVAIVTGGGQGIGQQIAFKLAKEGAKVIIADINPKGSRETVELISRNSRSKTGSIITDITSELQVVAMTQTVFENHNRIDILVNNTGIGGPVKHIENITLEEWEETMAVNLRGMFLCCKHVVPIFKKQNTGVIVNIASVSGKRPLPTRIPYATSKMGVVGFTRTLAAEVGKWKIRVNAVSPGPVKGPGQNKMFEEYAKSSGKSLEEINAEREEESPLKALIDPKYVAAVVAFLCSDDAAMMTGQDVNVSAGYVMY